VARRPAGLVTPPSKSNAWTGYACLLATIIGWGLNWPALKVLLREWPPLFSRGVAGVAAALLLAAIAARRGDRLRVPRPAIPRLLAASFTNVFAWMGFTTIAMTSLSVAEGALLVYTMPIWTTLLAWPLLGTRPSLRGTVALALGIAGVVLLLGAHGVALDAHKVLGIALALSSAVLFALGTLLNRVALPLSPVVSVMWQVGLGCAPMIALGLAFEHPVLGALSAPGWLTLAYMTVVPMGVCYLAWFAALRLLPPATASSFMLLVPLVGVVSASLMLGEPLGWREVVSLVLILGGAVLTMRK
jgi:drug/metabolite transporter (DMT)-like permease